jgi:hypothetical protein
MGWRRGGTREGKERRLIGPKNKKNYLINSVAINRW